MDARQQWEKRALRNSSGLSGVLFQGLSEQANSVLHDWHAWIIREVFLPKLPIGARILDLGCGYGRLSKVIADQRPDIEVVGQDLAISYCRTFASSYGPCIVADARNMPFPPASFDGIISITCLMYVACNELRQTLHGLGVILRPGGIFLSVDPGYELQRVVALLRGNRARSTTGGRGYTRGEYLEAFRRSPFAIEETGGNPRLSLALLIPGVAASTAEWVGLALANRGKQDHRPKGYSWFALHRWVMATMVGR